MDAAYWRALDARADARAELERWDAGGGIGAWPGEDDDGEDEFMRRLAEGIRRRRRERMEEQTEQQKYSAKGETDRPTVAALAGDAAQLRDYETRFTPPEEPVQPAPAIPPGTRAGMEEAMRSPAAIVAVPVAFLAPDEAKAFSALAVSCRRVLVATDESTVWAVRPRLGCKRCSGSVHYRVAVKGERRPCACVNDQVTDQMYPPEARRQVEQQVRAERRQQADARAAKVAQDGRAERLRELEGRLREMQAQRDAALLPIEKRIADHEDAAAEAQRQEVALGNDILDLAAEEEQRQRMADHYARLAEEERKAVAAIAELRREKAAGRDAEQAAREQALRAALEAGQERQRVLDRWADRTRSTERAIERLRSKVLRGSMAAASEAAAGFANALRDAGTAAAQAAHAAEELRPVLEAMAPDEGLITASEEAAS